MTKRDLTEPNYASAKATVEEILEAVGALFALFDVTEPGDDSHRGEALTLAKALWADAATLVSELGGPSRLGAIVARASAWREPDLFAGPEVLVACEETTLAGTPGGDWRKLEPNALARAGTDPRDVLGDAFRIPHGDVDPRAELAKNPNAWKEGSVFHASRHVDSRVVENGYLTPRDAPRADPDLIGNIRETVRAALAESKCIIATRNGVLLGDESVNLILNNIAREVARLVGTRG